MKQRSSYSTAYRTSYQRTNTDNGYLGCNRSFGIPNDVPQHVGSHKGNVSLLCLSYEYLWKAKVLQGLTFWVIIQLFGIPKTFIEQLDRLYHFRRSEPNQASKLDDFSHKRGGANSSFRESAVTWYQM